MPGRREMACIEVLSVFMTIPSFFSDGIACAMRIVYYTRLHGANGELPEGVLSATATIIRIEDGRLAGYFLEFPALQSATNSSTRSPTVPAACRRRGRS